MCFLGVISFAAVTLRLSGIQFLAKGLWVALRTLLVVGARLVQILGCNEVKITVVHNWAASEAYSRSSKLLMTFLLRVRGRRRGEDVDHHNAFPLVTKERMSVKRASEGQRHTVLNNPEVRTGKTRQNSCKITADQSKVARRSSDVPQRCQNRFQSKTPSTTW